MAEDKLNIDERLKIIRMQQTAYRQASKAEKGRILDTLVSGDPLGAQDHHSSPQWLL